jgi:hypothetical protein
MLKKILTIAGCLLAIEGNSQFLMDVADTTKDSGKYLNISESFGRIGISGYMQPQFQVAQSKGAQSFIGGNFEPGVNNRFMLRRGRIRFDYLYFAKNNGPSVQFVFQFDGTERGVNIRDFWGRIHENKLRMFSLSMGMFARPFSYEINRSSLNRESPERGRLTQLLMKTERDMGAMLTFNPRNEDAKLKYLKIDAGVFNGQGLAATKDFDSHKDFIIRVAHQPRFISKNIEWSGAVSWLNGGLVQNTKYVYRTDKLNNQKDYVIDSSLSNVGKIAPRDYYGADMQFKLHHAAGVTELRMEYITGEHTSSLHSTETPTLLFTGNEGYYIRKFNGGFFYLLHNIINEKHQLAFKYDWYDPNTSVKGQEIGDGNSLTVADVRYDTFGAGYIYYLNKHLKVTAWYDRVINEKTSLIGLEEDLKDDVFTLRLQFMF